MAEPQCQALPYVAYLSTHDLKSNASSHPPALHVTKVVLEATLMSRKCLFT